jgi:hypothetical protein
MGIFAQHDDNHREAVLVHFEISEPFDEFWVLNERLFEELDNSDAGEFDGNEIGQGEATLFAYGPDAHRLFEVMEPILKRYSICRDARVVLQKGDDGAPKSEFRLWAIN